MNFPKPGRKLFGMRNLYTYVEIEVKRKKRKSEWMLSSLFVHFDHR